MNDRPQSLRPGIHVTRAKATDGTIKTDVVHMRYIPGRVPHIVIRYLRMGGKLEMVRERQTYNDPAEDVLIL
jgi:hypothetical protein